MGQLCVFQPLRDKVQAGDGKLIQGQGLTVPEAVPPCSHSSGGCAREQ